MGLHIITSDGRLRKRVSTSRFDSRAGTYEVIEGDVFSDFYPGENIRVLRSFANSEVDENLIFSILHHTHKNFAILPNRGVGETFRREDTLLEDQARSWFQIDIDGWEWDLLSDSVPGDPHLITLKELAPPCLERLGLPTNIKFVAQRSSSAKLREGIYLRIYVFLDKELNSQELTQAFQAYDLDISMAEKGRLHITMPPVIADAGVKTHELAGPDVIKQDGELLKVADLKQGERPEPRYKKQGHQDNTDGRLLVERNLAEIFGCSDDVPLYDIHDIYSAMKEHSEEFPEKWKSNYATGYFLAESLNRTGSFKAGMEFLMSAPNIRRGLTRKHLESKKRSILRYQLARMSCGDIRKKFADEHSTVKRIKSLDMGKDLSDKEIEKLANFEGVLCLGGAEGVGKTELATRLFRERKPKTSISISYRKAVVKALAQSCGQEDYENITGSEFAKSVRQAKETLMPDCENLATCIQSIGYIVREDGSFENREVVWIDEIEHCLEELFLGEGFAGHGALDEQARDLFTRKDNYFQLSRMLRILIELCLHAKLVIVSDAKASDTLTGWFIEQMDNYGKRERFLLDNEADWLAKMSATFIESESEILLKIRDLLAEGKTVAIQTDFANGQDDSHPQMKKWERAIREISGLKESEVRCFTGSSFGNRREITIQNSPNTVIPKMLEEGVRVIMCSPWNQVGWSYKEHPMDATVSIITSNFCHAEDIKQGLRRWRKTLKHYLFIRNAPRFGMKQSVGKAYGDAPDV